MRNLEKLQNKNEKKNILDISKYKLYKIFCGKWENIF